MSLRVSDDDRPGFAILDFGREIAPGDVLIALRSKRLRPGEFVDDSGKWSKAPFLFRGVKRTEKAGTYLIGPEIVNHDFLAHDLIEVAVQNSRVVEELDWPELTPNLRASPLTTAIFKPDPPVPDEKPQTRTSETQDTNEAKDDSGEARALTDPPRKRPFLLWIGAGLGTLVLLLIATSWFFCAPFPFLNEKCSASADISPTERALEKALACAGSQGGNRPCEAAQCFSPYFSLNPPPSPERTSAENKQRAFSQICTRRRSEFEAAQSCAKGKEQVDPCAARQCLSSFLASSIKVADVDAEARNIAAELETKCALKNDDNAVAEARSCIARSKAPLCDAGKQCLQTYLAAASSQTHRNELAALADATQAACKTAVTEEQRDHEALKSAQQCAAGAADCVAKKSCYEDYKTAFPNGLHTREADDRISQIQCPPLPPSLKSGGVSLRDGTYSAWTNLEPSCATAIRSVLVTINGGAVSWEHSITPDMKARWKGSIDAQGNIDATVPGVAHTKATGRLTDDGSWKQIDISYPQCDRAIHAKIVSRVDKGK